jgi:hypothetical protein
MAKTKDQYEKRLKEIEVELKALQQQFSDIKKRATGTMKQAAKNKDEKMIKALRKKLGLK